MVGMPKWLHITFDVSQIVVDHAIDAVTTYIQCPTHYIYADD